MTRRNVLLLSASLGIAGLLVGCSSTASPPATAKADRPAPAPSAPSEPVAPTAAVAPAAAGEESLMIVYRQKRIVGMALNTSVYLDGVEVAELDPGTFVKIKLTPGSHRVWADEARDAITLAVESGRSYYFRMDLVAGLWKGNGKLAAVDESSGSKELAAFQCKPAEEIKVPALVVR